MSLLDLLRQECDIMAGEVTGTPQAGEVREVLARLDEPIRIAIAGRVKAGKSTLLNALVGERLAATDAGECTRIPTWYRHGESYKVMAIRRDGEPKELHFNRDDGRLDIDLGFLAVEDIERIEVEWPLDALKDGILIDTPGLASLDDSASVRTRDLLGLDHDRASQADAVLYCLRHLHKSDAEYLGAFLDHSVVGASAANAVAVLTRADEIGAGRPDALQSAGRIAVRYTSDPRVRAMCTAVVPVVGLMGETGQSLTEAEAATVRDIAAQTDAELADQLVSADRFAGGGGAVDQEHRADLLDRLGVYGIRVAVGFARQAAAEGRRLTAIDLGKHLIDQSGLITLSRVMERYFVPQADALKARSALLGLRAVAHQVAESDVALSDRQLGRLEQLEAASAELLVQRIRFLVTSGEVRLADVQLGVAERFLGASTVASRLGLPPDADAAALQARSIALVEAWRALSGGGLLDPVTAEAIDGLVHIAEGLHQSLANDEGS
jgi:hypothetical protein